MSDYPKPSFTVDSVVLAGHGPDTALLVIQRAHPPFQGEAALPGGFVDPFELPLAAAVRELEEETGLSIPVTEAVPLSLRTKKGRDPRGWTISQPYLFHLAERAEVRAGDDACRAFWLRLGDLEKLAFDHGAILCEALGRFWEGLPTFDPRLKGLSIFGRPQRLPERVTFFGGSFNPWHQGHTSCACLFPNPAELIVVPDSNPFKAGPGNDCYWGKFRAILAALRDIPCHVFPGFFGMETPNPTVGWLPLTLFSEKGLLVGDDNFATFDQWWDAHGLARALDHLYVVPRTAPEQDIQASLKWFETHHPHCRIAFLEDAPYRGLSSTSIRRAR